MLILPVLDLLNGVVVRGVAGQRESYRPVQSQIVNSPEPLAVARAFRDQFGLKTLYVADLDAILSDRPNFEVYRQLADDGFSIWVDAGIRDARAAEMALQTGAQSVIAGLESTASPSLLETLVTRIGSHNLIFSLDLKHGMPLSNSPAWQGFSPIEIGVLALECGVNRMIVLDLAQVGVGTGISTLLLCADIRHETSKRGKTQPQLITGGGVRGISDLHILAQEGIDGVLIASALHHGQLSRKNVEHFGLATPQHGD